MSSWNVGQIYIALDLALSTLPGGGRCLSHREVFMGQRGTSVCQVLQPSFTSAPLAGGPLAGGGGTTGNPRMLSPSSVSGCVHTKGHVDLSSDTCVGLWALFPSTPQKIFLKQRSCYWIRVTDLHLEYPRDRGYSVKFSSAGLPFLPYSHASFK